MNKQAVLNFLGLAMRAGKLVTGEEMVIKTIQKEQAKFVFVANDASENTRKRLTDKCLYYKVPINFTFDETELSLAIGRKRMIIAIVDEGFGRKFEELIQG
ncbi:ribosomal protein L7Ae-like RNA K-turn-binding protein [Enterococcus sp. PF1-24]|uniref:YlxQ-related RNA-binding protein n=1 Tax=unclassified Enterococcus TaxID=2608891 RepID=UPI0024754E93|nr:MULTISPECIES: YlxQ-related RNA-binding protein [unclassified Enterococcus]MDH6363040.1 ribosomal protein L7Ae-like RNA K-turn-binding protein [Enterococcus sp. PFB1-1]MDH6400134.1 ribosomal protein L7Ae-like RNA K-turn-binding protein [Enterococcus sp. PF1-24]